MSNKFPEVKNLDLPAAEQEILAWWDTHDIFNQSIERRHDGPTFTFYEGPPTANGRPGIHHVLGRTIKDTFCRYRTLKGYRVERKAGWDTHGLPVEIEVEKALGLEGRKQIEAFGIAAFNDACRESVLRYKEDWDTLTKRIGYWVDLDDPYVTYHASYIESVWWLIKQIYDKGLLYKGHKIQWYSPGSGTVLSSHEVSLGYKEITDPSVYVRFRSRDDETLSYLAWTTTPWTLISNVGLAVGPAIEYVKVAVDGATNGAKEYLILARDRLAVLKLDFEIVETYQGTDLVGRTYEPLFRIDESIDPSAAWRIASADYVSTGDGTGIVHIAPAFGAEDFAVGQQEGFPFLNPMGPDGHFTDQAELVAGMWFKDANKVINRSLRERGLLFRQDSYLHNYPHDWRKGTPLMSYPVDSWFIKTTAIKDEMVSRNKTINWYPPAIRDGRFGNWLENNVDWALSRKRYWGTPLPIWESDKEGSEYFEVIGSIGELREKCAQTLPPDDTLDLHRPFVDDLTWDAPDGGTMRRVTDVIDVWFDSGAMQVAQWHYPFANKDTFQRSFPADFICEGVDQTRGWFYTLHAIASLVMEDVAFKNVVVNGLILDENGEKMSKSKGNTVDPFEVVASHGADVVRWYMISNSPPWDNMKFSERALVETRNKFFSTLENVYRFMSSYANIDGFNFNQKPIAVAERLELDRWVVSRLNSTVKIVDDAYNDYDATTAARAVEQLVDELSNWYIRRSRSRFWASKKADAQASSALSEQVNNHDKECAYQTTYECLIAIAKMMSPIAPFFSEWLFRALNDTTALDSVSSVHLTDFPVVAPALIDTDLEKRMGLARTIVTLVLLLRNQSQINVRQPLARIMLVVNSQVERAMVERIAPIVLDELNVREIDYIEDSSTLVTRSAKANFKTLGPRLGKQMKAAAAAIAKLTNDQVAVFLATEKWVLEFDETEIDMSLDDVVISSEEVGDWLVAQEGTVTVALDTQITDELLAVGFAREVINRIQQMRKKYDFELTDRIRVEYQASGAMHDAIVAHQNLICSETLAKELLEVREPVGEGIETFNIGAHEIRMRVTRLPK